MIVPILFKETMIFISIFRDMDPVCLQGVTTPPVPCTGYSYDKTPMDNPTFSIR